MNSHFPNFDKVQRKYDRELIEDNRTDEEIERDAQMRAEREYQLARAERHVRDDAMWAEVQRKREAEQLIEKRNQHVNPVFVDVLKKFAA